MPDMTKVAPHPISRTSPAWTWVWLVWAAGGLLSALAIAAAITAGWAVSAGVWWWWAGAGGVVFAVAEVAALIRNAQTASAGRTLSEQVWYLPDGYRSLVVALVLWAAVLLATGNVWPSLPIVVLLWCAWHFAAEVPDDIQERMAHRRRQRHG